MHFNFFENCFWELQLPVPIEKTLRRSLHYKWTAHKSAVLWLGMSCFFLSLNGKRESILLVIFWSGLMNMKNRATNTKHLKAWSNIKTIIVFTDICPRSKWLQNIFRLLMLRGFNQSIFIKSHWLTLLALFPKKLCRVEDCEQNSNCLRTINCSMALFRLLLYHFNLGMWSVKFE